MLGIILWSSAETREAVVWCEDHGPLAYLSTESPVRKLVPWPTAGDVVDVTTEQKDAVRHVITMIPLGDRRSVIEDLLAASRIDQDTTDDED